jgi:hypothetical protein
MFPPIRWNELMRMIREMPLDRSIMRAVLWRIYAKHVTTGNIHDSTTQQWCSHQWAWRLNCHLKIIHTVSGYKVRLTIWSHHYIQTG